MKPILDPDTLAQLEQGSFRAAQEKSGFLKPISDPATIGQLEFGIDFTQPIETVRAAIGKLPEDKRDNARKHWADVFVAKENADGGFGQAAGNTVRTLARGTFVGPFLDEANAATSGAMHTISGGRAGAPYDEALAYQRARDRFVDEKYPVMSTVGQLGTGLATGAAAVRGGLTAAGAITAGPLAAITPAQTAVGRLGQAAGAGAAYGGIAGFGTGEDGVANRLESATRGAAIGTALGGGIGALGETVRGVRSGLARQGQAGAHDQYRASLGDTTLDDLSNMVATGATGRNVGLQRRTLDLLGEEMEAAGGNHLAARDATVQRLMQEHGIPESTARAQILRLTQVHADSPLLLGEYPAVAQSNRATRMTRPENIDIAEASQITNAGSHDLIDTLANTGGRADVATRTAVMDRQAGLGDWMRDRLQGLAPGGRTLADAEAIVQNAKLAAGQEYRAAYTGPVNTPRLNAGLQVAIRSAEQRLGNRGGDHADALRRAIEEFRPQLAPSTGQLPAVRGVLTELQAVQDARASVRGMMEAASRNARGDITTVLRPFYEDVTRAMSSASPAWRRANDRWADMNIQTRTLELGQQFAEKSGLRQREARREFARLAPEAQDMVRIGWLQKQFDKLDGMRDTHDISKVFDKNEIFNTMRDLFGPRSTVEFARSVRDAEVANRSTRMLGNSQTHRRGMQQKALDADLGIVAGAENASVHGIRKWLMEKLLTTLRDRRNQPLSDIVTTPMQDVFAVGRHLYNAQQTQNRLQQFNTPPRLPALFGGILSEDVGKRLGQDNADRRRRGLI